MKNIIHISDINIITNKILDGLFVPIYFDDVDLGIKFEKKLFDNGIRWPGYELRNDFYSFVKTSLPRNGQIILDINYSGRNIITRSYNFVHHVHVYENRIIYGDKFLVNNIFNLTPIYKPKK